MYATEKGKVEVCEFLIEKGADIHFKNNNGENAIFIAGVNNRREAHNLLLKSGAVLQPNKDQWTPLGVALLIYKDFQAAKFLLEMGADIHEGNLRGAKLLNFCVVIGQDFKAGEFLLGNGFNIDDVDANGATTLILAVMGKKTDAYRFLIDQGADINMMDKNGKSPLFWAAFNSDTELCKYLIERGQM